jgi:hypothetical protein
MPNISGLENRFRAALERGISNVGAQLPPYSSPSNESERWLALLDTLMDNLGSGRGRLFGPTNQTPSGAQPGDEWIDNSLTRFRLDDSGYWLSQPVIQAVRPLSTLAARFSAPLVTVNDALRLLLLTVTHEPVLYNPTNRWTHNLRLLTSAGVYEQFSRSEPGLNAPATLGKTSLIPTNLFITSNDYIHVQIDLVPVGSPPPLVQCMTQIVYCFSRPALP